MKTQTKICNTCGTERSLSVFYKDDNYSGGYRPKCTPCNNAVRRARYHNTKHTDKFQKERAHNVMKFRYGISLEQYNEMFERQKGLCAVCKQFSDKKLCVDHDHKTGKVRSLVCDRCNRTMGACNDNSHVLKACATYLESHQESF